MFGLSFLYPAFLVGALAAAVPVVLHLLRREAAPRLPFSAVRFLKRAPVEDTRRKHLRELLLLALRVTALVLLAAAFARPYVRAAAGAASAGVTIVGLDTSFSMSAPGQFERARQRALDAIGQTPPGQLVAVVAFHDAADAVVEPTMDRGVARAGVARLAPGFGGTRYRALLAKTGALVGSRPAHLVVVTDLQRTGWSGEGQVTVPRGVRVDVVDVGAVAHNLAVTAFSRSGDGATAVVLNAGDVRETARVRLTVDGRASDERRAELGAGDSAEVRFETLMPSSGTAIASVDDTLGYAADNARYLVLDPPEPADVLLVTSGRGSDEAFYVERALTAGGAFRVRTVDRGPLIPTATEETTAPPSAIGVLATRTLDRAAREQLASYWRGGGGIFIAAGDGLDPVVLGDQLGGPVFMVGDSARTSPVTLAPIDVRHPVFRPFGSMAGTLGQARFQRASRIVARPDDRVLSRFSDGTPALVERRAGAGRLLIFASDLGSRWNDFPRQPTFVPFVHEVVRYLAQERQPRRDFLVADAPRGVPPSPGVVVDRRVGRIAINVDPRESETTRLTKQEFEAAVGRTGPAAPADVGSDDRQREAEQRLWHYGLALMFVALFTEGLVGSRMA